MAATGREREQRAARERARAYAARQELHQAQLRRRRRDDLVAGIAGGVLVLAIAGAQTAYYLGGPGAPAPAATDAATPAPTPDTTDPAPSETPAGSETPAE